MNSSLNPINKRISIYRSFAGLTQEQAAAALGMKKNTYARMERYGKPTPEMLKKLASLYNVSVNMLLFGNDEGIDASVIDERPHDNLSQENPLMLTLDEKNCVKLCRCLPKSMQKMVMDLINNLYEELKQQNGQ